MAYPMAQIYVKRQLKKSQIGLQGVKSSVKQQMARSVSPGKLIGCCQDFRRRRKLGSSSFALVSLLRCFKKKKKKDPSSKLKRNLGDEGRRTCLLETREN